MKDKREVKTDLTKQELMKIFEEQVELKNAEIGRLEVENKNIHFLYEQAQAENDKLVDACERLSAIQQHYEKMPKENQSIYWTSICDDEIQDEFIGQKFFPDLHKWYERLGVLLKEGDKQ